MNLLENLISKEPFKDKLILGDYQKETLSALSLFFKSSGENKKGKVAIVANEECYLSIGKSLRDAVMSSYPSEALVFESLPPNAESFLKEYDAVISVGNSLWQGRLAILSRSLGFYLIAVQTSAVFADLFADRFMLSPVSYASGKIDKIVVDTEVIKSLNRNDLADGYAFSSSLALCYADYLMYATMEGESLDINVKEAITASYKTLTCMTKENIAVVLILSQLYLGKAVYLCPYLLESGIFFAGRVLSNLTASPLYECVFGLIAPLLLEVKGYLSLKDTVYIIPDINQNVEKLAEILKVDQTEIYQNFCLNDFDKIKKKRELLQGIPDISEELNIVLEKYKRLKSGYLLVYKGRHKRFSASQKEVKLALLLGGLNAKGVLKLMYDDGVTTAFSDL